MVPEKEIPNSPAFLIHFVRDFQSGFLTTDDTDLTDGDSSGLSVLSVVSVFCLFMVS